jgi:hypothetical protein
LIRLAQKFFAFLNNLRRARQLTDIEPTPGAGRPAEALERRAAQRPLLVLGAVCIALGLASGQTFAQQPSSVSLEASEEIFSVLAALNAAGYDTGLAAEAEEGTRDELRAELARRNPPILPQLRKFYLDHRRAGDPGADLGQYLSLALLLGSPPDFHLTVSQSDLPPDAKAVVGLVPLLKRFYAETDLVGLWSKFKPRYDAQISRYSEAVRRAITLADAYLRFPSGAYLGRSYSIDLCLLGAPDQVQARIYGQNYYLVVTPSKQMKITEIRHQYLHFLLDPLALKYAVQIHQKAALLRLARPAPMLGQDFKDDFPLLLSECLIRAVELRIDKAAKAAAEKSATEMTASGLVLVPYFLEALPDYEQQEASMSVYYKNLVVGIDLGREQKRLASVKFTPRPEAAGKSGAEPLSEEERLLNQGDNFIYENRLSEAKVAFESVLEKINPKSERALFGLGLVASNTRKPDTAETYFRKTLESASDLRLVTWSHIYLGRIYDLKGDRRKALEQYRAASFTAASYPEALHAVEVGIAHPFGSTQ